MDPYQPKIYPKIKIQPTVKQSSNQNIKIKRDPEINPQRANEFYKIFQKAQQDIEQNDDLINYQFWRIEFRGQENFEGKCISGVLKLQSDHPVSAPKFYFDLVNTDKGQEVLQHQNIGGSKIVQNHLKIAVYAFHYSLIERKLPLSMKYCRQLNTFFIIHIWRKVMLLLTQVLRLKADGNKIRFKEDRQNIYQIFKRRIEQFKKDQQQLLFSSHFKKFMLFNQLFCLNLGDELLERFFKEILILKIYINIYIVLDKNKMIV